MDLASLITPLGLGGLGLSTRTHVPHAWQISGKVIFLVTMGFVVPRLRLASVQEGRCLHMVNLAQGSGDQ